MSSSSARIVLEYVCPALGMVASNVMFSAPFRDVRKATAEGRLGDLNPTPWAVMLGNCCGWVTYSFLISNLFVFFGNAPGFILSVWLNMQAIKLQYGDFRSMETRRSILVALEDQSLALVRPDDEKTSCDKATNKDSMIDYAKIIWEVTAQNTKAPVAHEMIVLFMASLWVIVISIISLADGFEPRTREFIVGITVNANLVFFYGAPLSTIVTVLRTRSSASIHIPTLITNTLNGIFWAAFGIAVFDVFIAVPNGLGSLLGGIQIILCFLFPRVQNKPVLPVLQEKVTSSLAEPTQEDEVLENIKNKLPSPASEAP